MKNAKFTVLTAIVTLFIVLLSCSLDPYGQGRGANSTGGDTSILLPNIEIGGGGGGGGNNCTNPSAPSGVSCKANWWNEIQTSWSSVSGATSYEVYYSKTANGTYTLAGSTTSTTFKLGYLDGSTTYYFRVKALNSCGSSGLSNYSSAKTGLFG